MFFFCSFCAASIHSARVVGSVSLSRMQSSNGQFRRLTNMSTVASSFLPYPAFFARFLNVAMKESKFWPCIFMPCRARYVLCFCVVLVYAPLKAVSKSVHRTSSSHPTGFCWCETFVLSSWSWASTQSSTFGPLIKDNAKITLL
jgi:hypothetical protein